MNSIQGLQAHVSEKRTVNFFGFPNVDGAEPYSTPPSTTEGCGTFLPTLPRSKKNYRPNDHKGGEIGRWICLCKSAVMKLSGDGPRKLCLGVNMMVIGLGRAAPSVAMGSMIHECTAYSTV